MRNDRQSHSQGRAGIAALTPALTAPQAQDKPHDRCCGVARGEPDEVALRRAILDQQSEPTEPALEAAPAEVAQ